MGLTLQPAAAGCGVAAAVAPPAPPLTRERLPDSQVVRGTRDIAWVWLASPTHRYPHAALGSPVHAGSLQLLPAGVSAAVSYELPLNRVFEDRVPRLADLDGDGRDEIIVIEADAFKGAAVVVLGLQTRADGQAEIVEKARSPHAGSAFRWLNPVGVADFDGDGRADIASVTTPHIGGVLNLYHYRPPKLEPFATAMDVSNHRMGALEQQQAAIVESPGLRPTIILPDMTQTALHALRWVAPGRWEELADLKRLPARVARITPLPQGACVVLAEGSWWRATLAH